MTVKHRALRLVRAAHLVVAKQDLPDTIAIYFHQLAPEDRPAFSDAMTWFADHGYRSVCPDEFVQPGNGDRRLFVSFDDNFRDWFEAMDLFDRHGVRATFYVTSAPIRDLAEPDDIARFFDRVRYRGPGLTLSTDEIRGLHAAGHTIGCHTHSHPRLSHLPAERWADEILRSREILERCIDAPVVHFSYPFGMRRHFSEDLRRYCANQGFRTIATGISGLQHGAPKPLDLHRTAWKFELDLEQNLANLRIDARAYAAVTGRSAIG